MVEQSSSPRPPHPLAALYADEAPRLVTWARLRIRPEHRGLLTPEDVAQDVWCRALEKFDTFGSDHGSFRAWLLTIAKFVLAEATRRAFYLQRLKQEDGRSSMVRAREQVPAMITSVTSRAARDESTERLFEYLDSCDETDRRIFVLHFLEERPQTEVAAKLDMQANTVAKRWQRLRDRLRGIAPRLLGDGGDQPS